MYLAARDDFARLPPPLRTQLGTLQFVLEVALTPERKLARADAASRARQPRRARLPPAIPADDARSDDGGLGHRCLSRRVRIGWIAGAALAGARAHAVAGGRRLAARAGRRAGAAGVRARGVVVARHAHRRRSGSAMRWRWPALWVAGIAVVAALVAWPLAVAARNGQSFGRDRPERRRRRRLAAAVAHLADVACARTRRRRGRVACGAACREVEIGAWRGLGVAAIVAPIAGAGDRAGMAGPGRRFAALADGRRARAARTCAALAAADARRRPRRCRSKRSSPAMELDADAGAVESLAMEDNLETALYAAARSGRVERALHAARCRRRIRTRCRPPTNATSARLPMLAAVLPDLRLLRALIAHGVDLNAAHAGMTPLLAATRDSWHGRPEAVMTLLANGADPRVADADGNTPLHHAARSSDPGVAALLRDAAAEIDAINRDGITPLGIACASGNWRLARFLLERGAKPEPPARSARAARRRRHRGRRCRRRATAAQAQGEGRRARRARPQRAARSRALPATCEIVEALLAAGADAHARDIDGRTPWLEAARGGHLEVLERLLPHHPDVAIAERRRPRRADARRHGRATHRPRWCGACSTRPGSRRAATTTAARRRPRRRRRALGAGRRARSGVSAACGGRRCDGASSAQIDRAPVDAAARCDLRDGRLDDMRSVVGLLSPRELGALLRDMPITGPARRRMSPRASTGCWRKAPMPTQREGLERQRDVRAARARPRRRCRRVQALLRRGVSPAGSGGLARFLAACVHERSRRARARTTRAGTARTRRRCRSRPRPPAIRRWRWRCAWAGCALVERLLAQRRRPGRARQPRHDRAAPGRRARPRSGAEGAGRARRRSRTCAPPTARRRSASRCRRAAATWPTGSTGAAGRCRSRPLQAPRRAVGGDRRRSRCGAPPARPRPAGRCDRSPGLHARCCARPVAAIARWSTCCSRAAPIRNSPRTPARRRCRRR